MTSTAFISKFLVWVGLLPVVFLMAASAISVGSKLNSPCVIWGVERGTVLPSRLPDCRSVEGITETKQALVVRLVIWDTILALVCAAAAIGVFRSKPLWGYVSAGLFFVLAFPLIFGSLGILMLFAAGCCLMATILAIKAMPPEAT